MKYNVKPPAYQRHDISDKIWEKLAPHLLGQPGQWGALPLTTGNSSMQFYGYSVQVHLGGICRHHMGTGTQLPSVFAVGSKMVLGRSCSKYLLMTKITNGLSLMRPMLRFTPMPVVLWVATKTWHVQKGA